MVPALVSTETIDAQKYSPGGRYLVTQTCFTTFLGRTVYGSTGIWVYDLTRTENNSSPPYKRVYVLGIETCSGIYVRWQDDSTLVIYHPLGEVYTEGPPDDLHIIHY